MAVDKQERRLQRHLARAIERYRPMLIALVLGDLSPGDFEMQFFAIWGDDDDNRYVADDAFRVFEEFAFAVDDYVDNPELRGHVSDHDLGPEELKDRARELLRRAGFDPPLET